MTDEVPGGTTGAPTAPPGQSWLGRNGWLVAAVWLVFLVPPWLGIVSADDLGQGSKVAATVLLVVFAAVYVDGFRRQHRREQHPLDGPEPAVRSWTGGGTAALGHFAALVVLVAGVYLVAGVGAVGVIAFVVVFAVFHFPWPAAIAMFAIGLAVTAILPLLAGVFGEFWFLTLIVAGVGGAAVFIRAFDSHQFDQAHLRTRLALSDERTRVARDVHDVLGHSLTAVILKVELCQRLLGAPGPVEAADRERVEACRAQLAELDAISRRALAEIRSTVGGLRATDVADEVSAARSVLADAGVELLVTGEVADIAEGDRPMLAWVVREAVTNIVRHAEAERCHIELAPSPGTVLLRVTDDGVGLGDRGEGNGLRGLRERVVAAGGTLLVDSSTAAAASPDKPSGTRIEVTA